ncbi:sensor histidine kinase KdpD [Siculibacillus lacustris]|uniref:histidine kinase n=1 Tax=Siculibacillus lacustris TaxID=1549641 RepID=A0A4Q9VZR1_9HYPH|nr:sensor histidine kinase KdpD [Siculibacillus lacustris]TBW41368.1 sensor histidine kinase KdpD [Siculibacillus lacustris]
MTDSTSSRDGRPCPDALLALAQREERGRLKIHLGAAPGVGKTFAMLTNARRLAADGVDVVVGLAETHGRAETAALIEDLEVLARRPVVHRGRTLMEFDIDAALARRPALLIVDELAHTNAPGSRHPKRFQDVEELLDAGIDVWTALNIQHLESLSDVVGRITGVTIRETVPDRMLERADEVVLVDLTPDELIERLKEGKVYVAENAARAIDNFFRPSNLTALRELALRRTAARVDDQMLQYLRQNAIEGPWPTAERLLVCVGADEHSDAVVRVAARLAKALNATWTALHVDRPDRAATDEASIRRLDATMHLAERLGAERVRVIGTDLVTEILRWARRENVSQIVIGRSVRPPWWRRAWRRGLSEELVAQAADISVQVVTGASDRPRKATPPRGPDPRRLAVGLGVALAAVALSVGVGIGLTHVVDLPNVSMVFLSAVVLCALRFGRASAVAAAVLSFLAYNFFFIEPLYSFTVAKPHELFALVVFLFVAATVGSLAGRAHEQAVAALARARSTRALYEYSRKISGVSALEPLMWAAVTQVAGAIQGSAVALLATGGDLHLIGAFPPDVEMGVTEWGAARWAFQRGEVAGRRSPTLPNAELQFRPLVTASGTVGVIGYAASDPDHGLSEDDERFLASLADQTAIAAERIQLGDRATAAAASAESERLRSALLSSISHDLRTPLASILGSVTSLADFGDRLDEATRKDLLKAIEEETRRLSQFVVNLLDMTRLEAGNLELTVDWVDLADVARAAVARAARLYPGRTLVLAGGDRPLVLEGNATLLEQVLFNLIDNAMKFSDPPGVTRLRLAPRDGTAVIEVEDDGIGIPPDQLERVFDKFHRVAAGDGRAAGTGLGLSICRGVVTAMGGTITAASPIADGRGTRITVELPLPAAGPGPEIEETAS